MLMRIRHARLIILLEFIRPRLPFLSDTDTTTYMHAATEAMRLRSICYESFYSTILTPHLKKDALTVCIRFSIYATQCHNFAYHVSNAYTVFQSILAYRAHYRKSMLRYVYSFSICRLMTQRFDTDIDSFDFDFMIEYFLSLRR
jgi:hypothetical protein